MGNITWSYSSLSLYQQCPKKYYHLRVAKAVKEPLSEAISFGNEIHKIAHQYVQDGVPVPEKHKKIEAALESVRKMEGEKLCENKLGLTADLDPCGFFDKKVWWRGIADIIILQGDKAVTIDYKTGKSKFPDLKQLEIVSLAIFKHFPQVKKVRAGLMFLFADDLVKATYDAKDQETMWGPWIADTSQLQSAVEHNIWNAKPNFTCRGWCPVKDCLHNEGN